MKRSTTAAPAYSGIHVGIIMDGNATDAQIGGYLVALRMKGETVEEITGSAQAMRAHAAHVPLHINGDALLDTAGTGGDSGHTFNISTAAAFVIAGTGRKVAKHGNRAQSSHCGSADVLSALGVSLDLTPEARVGDYVVVHTGYAISLLDQEEAAETLRLLEQVAALGRGTE